MFKSKVVKNSSSLKLIKFFHNVTSQRLYMFVWLASIAALLESVGISLFFPILAVIFTNNVEVASSNGILFDNLAQYAIELRDQNSLLFVFIIILIVFLSIILIKSSLLLLSQVNINNKKRRLRLYLRNILFQKITNSNLEFIQKRGLGSVQSLLIEQAERVISCYASYCAFLVRLLITIMYSFFVFYLNPVFGLIAFSISFLIFTLLKFFNSLIRRESKKITIAGGLYNSEINGTLSALKYLTLTGRLSVFHKRVKKIAEEISNADWRMGNIHAFVTFIREPIAFLILCFVGLGSHYLNDLHWTSTLAAAALFYRSVTSAFDLQIYLQKFLENSASVALIVKEINSLNDFQDKLYSNLHKDIKNNHITISTNNLNVYRKGSLILKDVNISLKKGDCILISGKSGSGKTTLIDTLLGFIPWSDGFISINEKKYTDHDNLLLANSNVGYLGQRPSVFHASLLFNLTLRYNTTSEVSNSELSKIKSICKKINIWNDINRSGGGLNSILDSFGDIFSGGQLQRICLARELLRDRLIYIFDESTSALDKSTEDVIIKTISNLKKKALIIIISHSDRFLSICNKNFQIKNKKIIEKKRELLEFKK